MSDMHDGETIQKVRQMFQEMIVYKNPNRSKFFSALSIPSYLRDWLTMRFADKNGELNLEEVREYVEKYIPRKEHWEMLKADMVKAGEKVKILAKVRVEIDVKSGEGLFQLPDLAFPSRKYEAVVEDRIVKDYKVSLLSTSEAWGVVELQWRTVGPKEEGKIFMTDFKPFRPYRADLEYYQEARREFNVDEWIDILLMAIDYNPIGFLDQKQKLTLLSRLLPFVEKRINIVELAPKGTGKSYIFSQISKYGWLVSGGSITRAKMFYDQARKEVGLVTRYDYVTLDEIQTIAFPDINEMRGALKGFLENGEYHVGNYHGIGDAGFVLMGNIHDEKMNENVNMFTELPWEFQESALLDRFHGFIKGWDIPRMKENMKAEGWGLNTEYFSEIMHALRHDIRYRAIVDQMLQIPKGADTRDTEAIKRICSGYLKLLFPHVKNVEDVSRDEFVQYCLTPAKSMRSIIKRQLHIMDSEYKDTIPEIECL